MGTKVAESEIKELRNALYTKLKSIKCPRSASNITYRDRQAFMSVKENQKITVAETDKTNKLCITDKVFIKSKLDELMENSHSFTLLEPPAKDPTSKAREEAKFLLQIAFEDSNIPPYLLC